MRKSRRVALLLAVVGAATGILTGVQPPAVAADAGTHVIYVQGLSVIQGAPNQQCQYEWRQQTVNRFDRNTLTNRNFQDPIRDTLNIPQPTTLPPTCRDGDAATPGVQTIGCNIKRNLGAYPPYWRAADPFANGEVAPVDPDGPGGLPPVGPNPPCKGVLTASIPQTGPPYGCVDAETSLALSCNLNAPTWFYGYCGQTYGGDTSTDGVGGAAILRLGSRTWNITKLGFARGRGVWEFGARLVDPNNSANTAVARFYFTAIPNPNEPANAAGCDGGPAVLSVNFFGTIIVIPDLPNEVDRPLPPKAIRTSPMWHPCADDPGWNIAYNGVALNRMGIPGLPAPPAEWFPEGC